jgi:thiosulfate reductase cytochrome b subunit
MRLEPKHSLPTRLFHWINAPVLAVMIWSGLLIFWAYDVGAQGADHYRLRLFGVTLVKFFPDWFYSNRLLRALGWQFDYGLARGMAWHFAFMWIFALNGLIYVAYTIFSGEWRHLVPNRRSFVESWHVVLHDIGLRKQPLPKAKFNAAQRFAYTGVVLMGAGSLLTGLAIYKPTQLAWLTSMLGGYPSARAFHFGLTIGYVLFFVIHIAQVVRAGWNNFRAMVIGVEVSSDDDSPIERSPAPLVVEGPPGPPVAAGP